MLDDAAMQNRHTPSIGNKRGDAVILYVRRGTGKGGGLL